MCNDIYDRSGNYLLLNEGDKQALSAIESFEPAGENQEKLKEVTLLALNYLENEDVTYLDNPTYLDISMKCKWVHENFVYQYFKNKVKDLENNEYFNSMSFYKKNE